MQKRKVRAIGILAAILSISILSGCGTSKQKQVKTARTTQESNVTERKDSAKNTEEPTTAFSTTEVTTAKAKTTTAKVTSTTKSKKVIATTETPIATKKDEQKAAVKATVTYNGFSDTNSVEMKMSDGSYEVMIVEKEDLIKKLEDLDPGTKVTIQYKAKAGQANKQIIKVF